MLDWISTMAQELDDGEFWLPSDFLTDEDLLTDFKPDLKKKSGDMSYHQGFGIGNSFWGSSSNSEMSSPVESVNGGSTETESDEDDVAVITGLTRSMARSTLHQQDSSFYSDYGSKGWKLSGSPQSTLCGCKGRSPDAVSRVSSAAANDGWDFLCAAAGEVSRMRLMEETTPFYPANRIHPSQIQAQAHLAYLQLQASQLQRMKEQQMMNSGVWSQSQSTKIAPNPRPQHQPQPQALSMAAWPTLQQSQQQQQQQQSGSGMRAVFLGGSAPKKERTGTGVFLPRRFSNNNNSVPRTKPGCSTVLLPDRVVHALNLNLEPIDAQSHHRIHGSGIELNYDSATGLKKNNIPPRTEFRLPQEWTY